MHANTFMNMYRTWFPTPSCGARPFGSRMEKPWCILTLPAVRPPTGCCFWATRQRDDSVSTKNDSMCPPLLGADDDRVRIDRLSLAHAARNDFSLVPKLCLGTRSAGIINPGCYKRKDYSLRFFFRFFAYQIGRAS